MANPQNIIPDLTAAFTPQGDAALLPEGMQSQPADLRDAFLKNMKSGSFSGRHRILSTILGTLGGAAIGGIAGGMDSGVGAGRGALLGALMGGVQTPLLERQRKNAVAQSYMTMLPKLVENQKNIEEIRKGRAGGVLLQRAAQGVPLDELTSSLPMDAETLKVATDLYGGGASRPLYERLRTAAPQETGVNLGLSKMGQSNQVGQPSVVSQALSPTEQAMQAGGLEIDPMVSGQQSMAPLQGSASTQGAMPTYQGPIIPESALKNIATLEVPAITTSLSQSLDIPAIQSLANYRGAQTKSILEMLPYEIKALIARANQANASADLQRRTNPNLRSGGGARNQDMGQLNAQIDAAAKILGKDSGATAAQVTAALQFLSDTAGLNRYDVQPEGGASPPNRPWVDVDQIQSDIGQGFSNFGRMFTRRY